MTQRFTYYFHDGRSEVRVQPDAALPASGDVWVRGAYENEAPSALNVRVGTNAVKVWEVVYWLGLAHGDEAKVVEGYGLTQEDIAAAKWFYDRNRQEIDARIEQEMQPA
jgi:uncharacterized protein (DUF433 family)